MRRLRRRLLVPVGAACVALWLCRAELDLDARTILRSERVAVATLAPADGPAVDAIVRDPFAGAPAEPTTPPVASEPAFAGDVAVPNIDGSQPASTDSTPIVRATIVGPNPVAYVDDGAGLQIARVGDVVAGRNVASIDLQGIAFSDGTRSDLPSEAARQGPFPAAAVTPRPRAARTEPSPLARRLPVPEPSAVATPTPAGDAAVPTPAPLQTPDSRGLPPGANPTPDLLGPTPFSYPYPYPPPH